MKKLLAIILSFALLLSISATTFAAEVENEEAVPYVSYTLIDSFNLTAAPGETTNHYANYTGYTGYKFEYTIMGIDGVKFDLIQYSPSDPQTWVFALGGVAETNKVYYKSWNGQGLYQSHLHCWDSNPTGIVIHVRVYGIS